MGLTTNGSLIDADIIRKISERDLYQIDISFQTPDEKSFYATRGKHIDFNSYRNNILDFIQACNSRPEPPIFKVRIMVTRFAQKLRQKLNIPNFLGTKAVLRHTVFQFSKDIYHRLGLKIPDVRKLERKIREISIWRWNVIEISPKVFIETYMLTDWGNAFLDGPLIKAKRGYCFGMRDHFAILCNGDVTLCCVDYNGNTVMGNLKRSTLLEILNSPHLEKIVTAF